MQKSLGLYQESSFFAMGYAISGYAISCVAATVHAAAKFAALKFAGILPISAHVLAQLPSG